MEMSFNVKAGNEAVIREIMDYKWIESEKAGKDIGLSKATVQWIDRYYDEWLSYNDRKYKSL